MCGARNEYREQVPSFWRNGAAKRKTPLEPEVGTVLSVLRAYSPSGSLQRQPDEQEHREHGEDDGRALDGAAQQRNAEDRRAELRREKRYSTGPMGKVSRRC